MRGDAPGRGPSLGTNTNALGRRPRGGPPLGTQHLPITGAPGGGRLLLHCPQADHLAPPGSSQVQNMLSSGAAPSGRAFWGRSGGCRESARFASDDLECFCWADFGGFGILTLVLGQIKNFESHAIHDCVLPRAATSAPHKKPGTRAGCCTGRAIRSSRRGRCAPCGCPPAGARGGSG
jgi:hypothetical protein